MAESKHIDYARFMDDIDLGVDTLREAKQLLKQIDLVLQTRQVRLNSGKTKILSQIEAEKAFHRIPSHFGYSAELAEHKGKRNALFPFDAPRQSLFSGNDPLYRRGALHR